MEYNTLQEAIKEAERFIKKAKQVQIKTTLPETIIDYTKETATVKRASMDLTRTLSDLRQNR